MHLALALAHMAHARVADCLEGLDLDSELVREDSPP